MKLKYYISKIFVVILCAVSIQLNAQQVDGIAAVIEDNIVLQSDVEVQYQQMLANGMTMENMECEILDQLLLEKIFVVEAKRDSVIVTDDEVSGELNRRIQYFVSMFGNEEKLEEYYGKSIFDLKEEFRGDIYNQLLSERMRANIFASLYISPNEVFEFFNSLPEDSLPFFNAEVEVGQIVIFSEPNILQKEAAKEKAELIRKDVLSGSDFEFQALLYSDDPGSATQGGDLGFVQRGELVTAFEAAAFRLKENEISEVVETQFGFHVIQLLEKQGQRIHVRHILITPDIGNENVVDAENEIRDIKEQLISGELNFQKAVARHSKDEPSKNNGGLLTNPETGNTFFEMSQLEGDVALALSNMSVGDFTEVLPYQTADGKSGFRIVYLKSETEAHRASLDKDYSKIKAVAKQAKELKALNKWLAEKSGGIYINVNEPYKDCNVIKNWLN